MTWTRVEQWVDVLRRMDGFDGDNTLSQRGTQAAMSAALGSIQADSLNAIQQRAGRPYDRVVMVLASTVATAALEWCVVLLGRGSHVTLKVSNRDPGLAPLFARTAQSVGLPLTVTTDRSCLQQADLVIAMGQDDTIRHIQQTLPPTTRMLGFGHRFSVAWVSKEDATDPSTWMQLAFDVALHDSRGCMTPIAVFTDAPTEAYWDLAVQAMRETEAAIPRGRITPIEGAYLRSRHSLARVTGRATNSDKWSVHALPAELMEPQSLPRSLAIFGCQDDDEARRCLHPYKRWLSVVGLSEHTDHQPWIEFGAERTCRVGDMQRPPLERLHNGVDWLRETIRPHTP